MSRGGKSTGVGAVNSDKTRPLACAVGSRQLTAPSPDPWRPPPAAGGANHRLAQCTRRGGRKRNTSARVRKKGTFARYWN